MPRRRIVRTGGGSGSRGPTSAIGGILSAVTEGLVGHGQGKLEREELDRERAEEAFERVNKSRTIAAQEALRRIQAAREEREAQSARAREKRDEERLGLEKRRTAAAERRASGRASGSTRSGQRQDLASVERQVDDTRADLARVERDAPEKPLVFSTPGDSVAFERRRGESASRAAELRVRADSLGRVRDSLAGVVQGRDMRRADFSAVQGGSASSAIVSAGKGQQLEQLEIQYENALEEGADPDIARATYERERRRILGGA